MRWTLALVALAFLAGCSAPDATPTTTGPTATTAPATTTSAPPVTTTQSPSTGAAAVSIVNFAFDPATLHVAAGTNVTWTNADSAGHTVTASGGAFGSGRLAEGETFRFLFSTPGTIEYRCSIHSSMKGTIIVS